MLAALALLLAAIAVAVPFMEETPGGIVGSMATLLIVAEVFAGLAILVVGKELYGKIWAKLQSMRAELAGQSSRGHDQGGSEKLRGGGGRRIKSSHPDR
jgi:hypothetical protein